MTPENEPVPVRAEPVEVPSSSCSADEERHFDRLGANGLGLTLELLDLDLPEECREGVAANLRLIAEHARRVAGDDA